MLLSDLPRPWARRCLGIARFCREALETDLRESTLVLAYSTGLDSTALLHLLVCLAPRLRLTLIPAHLHHGLRPEADQELQHAVQVCASLDLPCVTRRVDILALSKASRKGIEETARRERYAFLESVRVAHDADWIVTAHHADDLAEDVLLRLVRGTGWPALGGMPGMDSARHVLRPVLDWQKRELRDFLQSTGLDWKEDLSNISPAHTRNRIRHGIIPLLRAENPSLSNAILHLWAQARADEKHWTHLLSEIQPGTENIIAAEVLQNADQALRLRLYKHVLDAMGPGELLGRHLFTLDRAWTRQAWGKTVQFGGDKTAQVRRDGIAFSRQHRRDPADATTATSAHDSGKICLEP